MTPEIKQALFHLRAYGYGAEADAMESALASAEPVAGLSLRFGMGAWIVNTGAHDGEPCVFIDDAPKPGKVGERAEPVREGTTPRLRLLFPTDDQCARVADALVNAPLSPSAASMRDLADMLDPEKQADVLRAAADALPAAKVEALMRDALDHIAKTCKQSRTATRRLNWIQARAEQALAGEPYKPGDHSFPPNGESAHFRLVSQVEALKERIAELESAPTPASVPDYNYIIERIAASWDECMHVDSLDSVIDIGADIRDQWKQLVYDATNPAPASLEGFGPMPSPDLSGRTIRPATPEPTP